MTRIKYTKHDMGWFTKELYLSPTLVLMAAVFNSNHDGTSSFAIHNTADYNHVVYKGKASNLRAAKSQVRKKLIEFGLILEEEIRS